MCASGRSLAGSGTVPIARYAPARAGEDQLVIGLGPAASPVAWPGVSDRARLYDFELEPEVRDWLDSLSDSDFKRVDEVCGMLAEKGAELGGPWSDHLEGPVWELRIRLRDVAARVTVFRKTRQHDQRQIGRAVRAQELCQRDHRGPAAETYEGRCDDWLPHPLGAPGGTG